VKHHSDAKVYQIRAAVLRKKGGPFLIESLELEGLREDEVLVRLVASGICHTDEVLNPHGVVALLTGETGTESLPEGRKTIGIIQGDAVPQHFIPKLIELYQAGRFPFDRLLKFYDFSDINRAIADAKRGDTVKPVLRISEV